jgi:hypothetical protein
MATVYLTLNIITKGSGGLVVKVSASQPIESMGLSPTRVTTMFLYTTPVMVGMVGSRLESD